MLLLIYDHYSFYAVHILIYVNVKDVKIINNAQRHFSQQFLPESQGVECLDMGTSRFVWWKLKKLGVLKWK